MTDRNAWQIHANVNTSGRDAALRVTISVYDENGDLTASRTWRKHVVPLAVEGLAWQALAGVQDLTRMMSAVCQEPAEIVEVDEPLF